MIGLREYRSANAPHSGRNGMPMMLAMAAMKPTQALISLGSVMPKWGR
jgi:hypothetical protein